MPIFGALTAANMTLLSSMMNPTIDAGRMTASDSHKIKQAGASASEVLSTN
jgi:hypothetical protein